MPQNGAFAVTSYRIARGVDLSEDASGFTTMTNAAMDAFKKHPLPPHSSHPDFGHLIILVLGAVLEVVCVSLPGYIVARLGMFDAENQKFIANLNTQLFTPCLSMYNCCLRRRRKSLICDSLHQARIPIDRREACGPSYHTGHLHSADIGLVPLLSGNVQGLPVPQAGSEFRHSHGRM
jgi:hypothetical protein